MTRDDVKRIALEVLEEQLANHAVSTGSFGYELSGDQRTRLLDIIAQDIADRVTREAM